MMRTLVACFVAIACLAGAAGASSPPPVTYNIVVEAHGAAPQRIWIEQGGTPFAELTPGANGYAAIRPIGGQRLAQRATLVAQYPQGERVSLPIRLLPGKPSMRLAVYNHPREPCTRAVRLRLLDSRSDFQTLLEAYYKAKKVATYRGPEQCQDDARGEFERVWYDLSYELGRRSDHIDLDSDASGALRRTQPTYVAQYDGQMAARYAALDFAFQRELQANNEPLDAWYVNDALARSLTADTEYAAVVSEHQELPISAVASEGRRIERSLERMGIATPQ